MNVFIKWMSAAVLWGILQGAWITNNADQVSIEAVILRLTYGEVYFLPSYLMEVSLMMFPYVVFQIVFGMFLYRHFCSASIYYFSRQNSREIWYAKETFRLYIWCLLYVSVLCVSVCGIVLITGKMHFTLTGIILMFMFLVIHSFWLFVTTMIINILSLVVGNNIGFMITMILQFAFVFALFLFHTIIPLESGNITLVSMILFKLNPVSQLIFKWHTSIYLELDAFLHMLPMSFPLLFSVVYFMIVSVIIFIIGMKCIKGKELLMSDMEQEGI